MILVANTMTPEGYYAKDLHLLDVAMRYFCNVEI